MLNNAEIRWPHYQIEQEQEHQIVFHLVKKGSKYPTNSITTINKFTIKKINHENNIPDPLLRNIM